MSEALTVVVPMGFDPGSDLDELIASVKARHGGSWRFVSLETGTRSGTTVTLMRGSLTMNEAVKLRADLEAVAGQLHGLVPNLRCRIRISLEDATVSWQVVEVLTDKVVWGYSKERAEDVVDVMVDYVRRVRERLNAETVTIVE